MSALFWAVFDEKQKAKAEEILATFDKDSKDEMGLMSITMALSSLMFPGTSVLHTRLRYVFLVGWIFLEALKHKSVTLELLHKKEKELRKILQNEKKNCTDSNLYLGILGVTKIIDLDGEGENLSQPPFSIYFNLLKEWNIIRDKSISVNETYREVFCSEYLEILENKFDISTFILTKQEKSYISKVIPDSILSTIFEKNIYLPDEVFLDFDVAKIGDQAKEEIFIKSQNLSLLMWGVMLYYNYYLSGENSELEENFIIWKQGIKEMMKSDWIPQMTLNLVTSVVNISQELFIDNWFKYIKKYGKDITLENAPKIDGKSLKYFLMDREKTLKGDRSRLLKKQNGEVFNDARFGINPPSYRWSNIIKFKKDYDYVAN